MTTTIGARVRAGLASITDTLAELGPHLAKVAEGVPWVAATFSGVTVTVATGPVVKAAQEAAAGQEPAKTCPHCGR